MYLLDSDTISETVRNPQHHETLARRVRDAPPGTLLISVVTIAELMQGILALIRRFEKTDQEDYAYSLLAKTFDVLQRFPVVSYGSDEHRIFLSFSPSIRRIGGGDCQIAAMAIHHGYIVVTRNVRHFRAIPDVQCEDWTQP